MSKFNKNHFLDLGAFIFGVALAWLNQWETKDLVWSLWLSSLVVGYISILLMIIVNVIILRAINSHQNQAIGQQIGRFVTNLLMAVFLIAFFTLHFGGFHFGHALALMQFFPLEGMSLKAVMSLEGVENMSDYMSDLGQYFSQIFYSYYLFVILIVIAEKDRLFGLLFSCFSFLNDLKSFPPETPESEIKEHLRSKVKGSLMSPYINVIRLHCLIFFFAFWQFTNLNSFLGYVVIYAVYFLPWRVLSDASDIRES